MPPEVAQKFSFTTPDATHLIAIAPRIQSLAAAPWRSLKPEAWCVCVCVSVGGWASVWVVSGCAHLRINSWKCDRSCFKLFNAPWGCLASLIFFADFHGTSRNRCRSLAPRSMAEMLDGREVWLLCTNAGTGDFSLDHLMISFSRPGTTDLRTWQNSSEDQAGLFLILMLFSFYQSRCHGKEFLVFIFVGA